MANFTKKAIIQTFQEMLVEMPFDKITVSALAARCGLSSNTFYYHFQDIYDLLETWLGQEEKKYIHAGSDPDSWEEDIRTILHILQDNPKPVYHLVNSLSRERIERYVFSSLEPQFYDFVQHQACGLSVPEEKLQHISSFFCYSLLGFVMKFLWSNMSANVDRSVAHLAEIYRGIIESMTQQALEASNPLQSDAGETANQA